EGLCGHSWQLHVSVMQDISQRQDGRERPHQIERRKDPKNPTKIEVAQADPCGAIVLDPQQGGDQIPTQEEEYRHTERAGEAIESGVVDKHDAHSQRAYTIEGSNLKS